MRRRLSDLVTTASLIALAVAAALWVRSRPFAVWDNVSRMELDGPAATTREWRALSWDGGIIVVFERRTYLGPAARREFGPERRGRGIVEWFYETRPSPSPMPAPRGLLERLGVRHKFYRDPPSTPALVNGAWFELRLSYWLIMLAALPAPLLAARRIRRRSRRFARGLCSACGYDLRATADRCPECGTVPVRHASIAEPIGAESA